MANETLLNLLYLLVSSLQKLQYLYLFIFLLNIVHETLDRIFY